MATDKTSRLINAVFSVSRLMRESVSRSEGRKRFSLLQFKILMFITEHGNPTMREIADFLGITPPSATSIIQRLVRSGRLKRIVDPTDRRKVRLTVSQTGKSMIDDAYTHMALHMRQLFSVLNEREREELTRILTKITARRAPR